MRRWAYCSVLLTLKCSAPQQEGSAKGFSVEIKAPLNYDRSPSRLSYLIMELPHRGNPPLDRTPSESAHPLPSLVHSRASARDIYEMGDYNKALHPATGQDPLDSSGPAYS